MHEERVRLKWSDCCSVYEAFVVTDFTWPSSLKQPTISLRGKYCWDGLLTIDYEKSEVSEGTQVFFVKAGAEFIEPEHVELVITVVQNGGTPEAFLQFIPPDESDWDDGNLKISISASPFDFSLFNSLISNRCKKYRFYFCLDCRDVKQIVNRTIGLHDFAEVFIEEERQISVNEFTLWPDEDCRSPHE